MKENMAGAQAAIREVVARKKYEDYKFRAVVADCQMVI